jgi:hypothetical protein
MTFEEVSEAKRRREKMDEEKEQRRIEFALCKKRYEKAGKVIDERWLVTMTDQDTGDVFQWEFTPDQLFIFAESASFIYDTLQQVRGKPKSRLISHKDLFVS